MLDGLDKRGGGLGDTSFVGAVVARIAAFVLDEQGTKVRPEEEGAGAVGEGGCSGRGQLMCSHEGERLTRLGNGLGGGERVSERLSE